MASKKEDPPAVGGEQENPDEDEQTENIEDSHAVGGQQEDAAVGAPVDGEADASQEAPAASWADVCAAMKKRNFDPRTVRRIFGQNRQGGAFKASRSLDHHVKCWRL